MLWRTAKQRTTRTYHATIPLGSEEALTLPRLCTTTELGRFVTGFPLTLDRVLCRCAEVALAVVLRFENRNTVLMHSVQAVNKCIGSPKDAVAYS